jgi:hypothetical protein
VNSSTDLFSQMSGIEDLVLADANNLITMSNLAQTAVTGLIGETFTIDASAESSSHGLTVVTTSALTDAAHLDIIGGVGNDLIELTSEHFHGHRHHLGRCGQ